MNFKGLKVLVVDDVPTMCQITSGLLRALGFEQILIASNGVDALRMLEFQPGPQTIDLVLSDWNMPVMDGLQLLRAVRANPKLARLPVLMVTAEADRYRIQEAISSGVSDLLVKPYTRQRLEDKIAGVLTHRGGGAALVPAPVAASAAAKAAPPRPTLLVVDDMPDNLRLIADLFDDRCRVRVAHSGAKALAICMSDTPPDLVLLDVMMPEMDGFEVAQRLREHPASAHIPIIFITALDNAEARRKGLGLGAVDFVSKPVDPEILQLRVNNFLSYISTHLLRQAEYDAMLDSARLRENVERMLRHDVSSPLAGVVALAAQLAADATLSPEHAAQARLIESSAQQALGTIRLSHELLLIETGKFHLDAQPLHLEALLRDAAGLARAASGGQIEIDVTAENGVSGVGDPMLCQAVFLNLLKNACEAAPPGSRVSVKAQAGNPVRVEIMNRGVVPQQIRERFFERGASHGKEGGSGIGTYSARLLAEAQGGGVEMETDDGAGRTVLTVTLPGA